MNKFLIQLIDNEIVYDFAFHLKEAIKYINWFYKENNSYSFTHKVDEKDFTGYIPIGSIDFVMEFYKKYHGIEDIKPINIPKELNKEEFLKRTVITDVVIINKELENGLDYNREVFVKSIDKFKDFTEIIKVIDIPLNKNVLVSTLLEIESEWRGFVYRGQLLDIRCYSGNFTVMPDVNIVKDMIKAYGSNSPTAYTIDVAVTEGRDTVLIEVHQFFSCGLYGFNNYKYLLNMFIATHREILNRL